MRQIGGRKMSRNRQQFFQTRRVTDRFIVELSQTGSALACLFRKDDRNNLYLPLSTIEYHECAVKHQQRIIRLTLSLILSLPVQCGLKPVCRLVSEVSHRPSRERRKLALIRQLSLTKMMLEIFCRRLIARFEGSVFFNDSLVAAAPDDHVGVCSYERILRYAFAALNRLQEKCVVR